MASAPRACRSAFSSCRSGSTSRPFCDSVPCSNAGVVSAIADPQSGRRCQLMSVTQEHDDHDAFDGVETFWVDVSGNRIFARRYGGAPPILLVHGFPRTSLMWRDVAPQLATDHTVIAVDLRAYGRSGTPESTKDHFPYSKRAMADELVEVMSALGHPTFTVIGHDRGGRVSYRMALDHP